MAPTRGARVGTMDDRITLYGSFTSSSTYKPMLFLALARLAFLVQDGEPQDRQAE